MKKIPENARPIGYRALVDRYNLAVIPHFRWSYIIDQGGRQVIDGQPALYIYDSSYALDNPEDSCEQLAFALKHEGMNLEIIRQFFEHCSPDYVERFVAAHSSGKYQRIMWYLYEQMMYFSLDIPDLAQQGSYVSLLDEEEYYTAQAIAHKRYRIHDNLLGTVDFCPLVRKTEYLKNIEQQKLDQEARAIIDQYDNLVLERASNYLYAQETMSSYRVERERPTKARLARVIQLMRQVERVPTLTQEILVDLQNSIVEDRYAQDSYRKNQNYIGQSHMTVQYETVYYISPRPQDVSLLMSGLLASLERMIASNVHPIVIAAAISFGFVFIHPFEDGNGRLHRFLIHYILHKTGFTPPSMIFPVSAVIVLDKNRYNAVLESFSKPLMAAISSYEMTKEGVLMVHQNSFSLYAYIDYTSYAEFLADCIKKTIQTDFKNELEYLVNFDKAFEEIQSIVDMPDRFIDLFISVVVQNHGTLSAGKRDAHFSMLTDDEIHRMEAVVQNFLLSK